MKDLNWQHIKLENLDHFLSPYFKDGVDTITGAAVWTMIWKDVDFPIDGRYTLKAEADHILTVKVGGKEIEKIKSDQNVVKVKFTAPKGKNDIELKLKNEMKTGGTIQGKSCISRCTNIRKNSY